MQKNKKTNKTIWFASNPYVIQLTEPDSVTIGQGGFHVY